LSRLTGLTNLTGLAVRISAKLICLPLPRLPLLARLPVAAGGIAHAARQGFHLVAKPLDLIEGFLRILLLAVEGLLRLMQLIIQALHAIGDGCIPAILGGIDSAANPVRTLLHAVLQVILLHAAEGFAQFAGGIRLRAAETPSGLLHLLFEPAERVGGLLTIVSELGLLAALI
jgi:hypothetical protein